jgi:Holliday junction resolvase RusA-like endonuclease
VPKYRTNEGLIGDPVTKKPDADNIGKLVLDALNGVAYKDDSQVFSIEVEKIWAEFDSVQVWVFETIPRN